MVAQGGSGWLWVAQGVAACIQPLTWLTTSLVTTLH